MTKQERDLKKIKEAVIFSEFVRIAQIKDEFQKAKETQVLIQEIKRPNFLELGWVKETLKKIQK